MPAHDVMTMISRVLEAMAVGLPGVFAVLAVFYVILKILMSLTAKQK